MQLIDNYSVSAMFYRDSLIHTLLCLDYLVTLDLSTSYLLLLDIIIDMRAIEIHPIFVDIDDHFTNRVDAVVELKKAV